MLPLLWPTFYMQSRKGRAQLEVQWAYSGHLGTARKVQCLKKSEINLFDIPRDW